MVKEKRNNTFLNWKLSKEIVDKADEEYNKNDDSNLVEYNRYSVDGMNIK